MVDLLLEVQLVFTESGPTHLMEKSSMFPIQFNCWLPSLGCLVLHVTCQAADPPKEITNSIGMKLTLIPAGEFMMGSDTEIELHRLVTIHAGVDRAMRKEYPQHRVSITQPYYLSITEVRLI